MPGERRGEKLVRSKQLVWKTVPITDSKGVPRRAENPLHQYGIDVTQVLISDPRPEDNLNRLLMDKKRLVAERIKTVQEQETSKAQARTEQLKKEIQRTKEVQDAQREKELRVINGQREVEVAKQVAERETVEQRKLQDLAVIQKDKELSIAKAELDIQKANANAARYQAEAIAAKGKAEADVLKAMYQAKAQNKEIFLAEVQRDIAQSLYANLKGLQGGNAQERDPQRRRGRRGRGQDAEQPRRDHRFLGAWTDGEGHGCKVREAGRV